MLRHTTLFDPVKRSDIAKDIDFDKYVRIHQRQIAPTNSDLVEEIKRQLYSHYADRSQLDKVWEFVRPKIKQNAGLAEFILDYDAAKSDYFFPWLINIFRSPATALEMSYGAGPDLNDHWSESILDTDDPLVPFIKDDPAFVYNRERQLYTAGLVTTAQDIAEQKHTTSRVIDFGAGRLAWARRHGFGLRPGLQTVYAFDKDSTIVPTRLFSAPIEALGIYYRHSDFISQLASSDCSGADLVILGGVVCYIPTEVFVGKIVPAIYRLLVPGGVFFFDLQIECPCYRHSMDILDWPTFDLPETPSLAMDAIESIRKALWTKNIKFSAEYIVDTYNRLPSAIMVTMQKL